MNLTTDAWIPIVWDDGTPGTVSLRDAFERGQEIQDLALRPHERIAVTRLLICIAQAGLDGPVDYDDWKACRPRVKPSAIQYLNSWPQAFELLGNGQRFLQVPNLEKRVTTSHANDDGERNLISKLDLMLATGNNSTLFDNAGGSARGFQHTRFALTLLTFQCFSPGGRIGVALWGASQTPGNGSSKHAPCLADGMLHTLLRADNLLATLHKNLLNRTQVEQLFGKGRWGKPVWELTPSSLGNADAVQNSTGTYLGRLVPLARAIRLEEDGRHLILANGLEYASYADGWREPSATIVARTVAGRPKREVLRASTDKAAWRELHALTVKAIDQNPGGPAVLQNIPGDEEAFDLWVGGMVANKAKLVDTTESVFHIPAAMLTETSQRVYEQGVEHAGTSEYQLRRAVSVYHEELGDHLDRPEMKDRRLQVQRNAVTHFWTDVEQAVPALLGVAAAPGSLGLNREWRNTAWGQSVQRAVSAAYERACPHETPRQMRAYVRGLGRLYAAPATQAERGMEVES